MSDDPNNPNNPNNMSVTFEESGKGEGVQFEKWNDDKRADLYDQFVVHGMPNHEQYLLELLDAGLQNFEDPAHIQVLDIAAGTATAFPHLVSRSVKAENYTAIDISEPLARKARQLYPGINFAVGDISNASFGENQVQLVISNNGYYNFPFELQKQTAVRMARALEPGGIFVFNGPKVGARSELVIKEAFITESTSENSWVNIFQISDEELNMLRNTESSEEVNKVVGEILRTRGENPDTAPLIVEFMEFIKFQKELAANAVAINVAQLQLIQEGRIDEVEDELLLDWWNTVGQFFDIVRVDNTQFYAGQAGIVVLRRKTT